MGLWPVTRSHSQHRANDTKALAACSKTSRMNWDPRLLKIPASRHLLRKPTLCQQKEQMKPRAHRGELLINPRTGRTSVSPSITISTRTPQNTMKDNDSDGIIIQMSLDRWKEKKKIIVKGGRIHTQNMMVTDSWLIRSLCRTEEGYTARNMHRMTYLDAMQHDAKCLANYITIINHKELHTGLKALCFFEQVQSSSKSNNNKISLCCSCICSCMFFVFKHTSMRLCILH